MESITVDELKEKIVDSNPVNIVDVRTNEETAMGIIPGMRSERTGQYLEENGINVVNVEGGMDAWGDEGLEVDSI